MVIGVPVGKRTITYTCPDILTLDTYPVVQAEFAAGQSYLLECDADSPGVIRARQCLARCGKERGPQRTAQICCW